MKRVLLSTAVLLTAGAALAADLPTRKEPLLPPPPPPPLWTGFYAGLNAGYGFGTNSSPNAAFVQSGSWSPYETASLSFYQGTSFGAGSIASGNQGMAQSGFVGGGQFGYNYQWGSNFLVGFEADIQGTTVRGGGVANSLLAGNAATYRTTASWNGSTTGFESANITAGLDYLGTARGRIGYLFTPALLIYGTGGLAYGGAYANIRTTGVSGTSITYADPALPPSPWVFPSVNQMSFGQGSSSALLVGYSAGGGFEWLFMPSWSLKTEAIYYNLGNMNVSTASASASAWGATQLWRGDPYQAYAGPGSTIGRVSLNYQGVIARMGVNYHFNLGGAAPIVAKY